MHNAAALRLKARRRGHDIHDHEWRDAAAGGRLQQALCPFQHEASLIPCSDDRFCNPPR
jgi:hypothetical protein